MIRSKEDAKRALGDVYQEFYFYVQDGKILKNMKDLAKELRTMSSEVYHKHVTENKNDFVNWVRDIVKDEHLAKGLQELSKSKAARLVTDRIRYLENKVKPPKRKTKKKPARRKTGKRTGAKKKTGKKTSQKKR